MPTIEISLDELMADYDWAQVFADENDGNVSKNTDSVLPGMEVSLAEPTREDVVEIIAAVNGENDGDEWIGVFLLADGRYLVAQGGCDYTGWDCRAGNSLRVANTLDDAIRHGLTEDERSRLGLRLEDTP